MQISFNKSWMETLVFFLLQKLTQHYCLFECKFSAPYKIMTKSKLQRNL